MATGDTTRLVIELELLLKNLDKTLRGLDQVKQKLSSVASVKLGQQSTAGADRAAAAAQRLANQQQRLSIQAQELANRQERVRQVSERLALSNQRLNNAQQRVARSAGVQADAHVRAFRAIQKGIDNADSHVRFFRANEAALKNAPQLDAHVKAFRAIEEASQRTSKAILGAGNALRSIGQGLSTVGATLSVAVTAPLVAFGAALVDAAVRLDSLKRGLTAITGSSQEATAQLARLTQLAKLPGIGFEEAIQGSIRLQAVGFSAKEAEKSLREFANAVALTGGGREELSRITVQLGQLAAKGKVLSQDLRPIIESAPAVGRALLQAFGTVNADDIQELGLSTKEFLGILTSQLEQLPRAAAGAKNSFENFRDEVFRAAATVGEVLLPPLIRLAETVGPVITKLAGAFGALPQPLQVVVLGIGALFAGLGPVLFVVGQLTTGIGRLVVGFAQLNTLGILPTIKNLRALTTGALTAAQAQRTLAATGAFVAAGIGGILTVVSAVVTAFAVYNAFQKDSIALGQEHVDALTDQIKGLQQQTKFIDELKDGVERTANEQERLLDIYSELNTEAKLRVSGIVGEEQHLAALREELQKLIQLREQERVQAAAALAGELANGLQRIQANQDERDSITSRIQANAALVETLQREQVISTASNRALAERGITASTVEDAIGRLKAESENLSNSQDELIKSSKDLNSTAKDQAAILRSLQQQTGLSARQLLVAAQSMGVFRGDIEATLILLERYIADTEDATRATDEFSRALSQQQKDLLKGGEQADAEAKRRRESVAAAAAIAREASDSFEGALKFLNAFIAAQPRLRADVERERQIQGKSLSEFLQDALQGAFKRKGDRSGTSLRNAQEQLAKALAEVALASSERQVAIEKEKNERLLQANESAQRLQIISYREFLETRAALTAASIDREISQQADVVRAARTAQLRLTAAAGKPGISQAERVKRQAQAAEANEAAIKAETKLAELQSKREAITETLQQSLKEFQFQQLKDIRQLEIEYAQLTGRIEDSLNAATDEKFRESLQDLALAQDRLNKQIIAETKAKNADRVAELELARAQNQRQIDAINNIVIQERALNRLAAAEEVLDKAKQRQSNLEDQLDNDIALRGLSEEQAINRRLAGERELSAELTRQRDQVEAVALALFDAGRKVPKALTEFIAQTDIAIERLGKLTIPEQFRLIQDEFNRLNDERVKKIQDVERAVRNRTIAEVEGSIQILNLNGQYTAALEQQLVLLKQVAVQVGKGPLRDQLNQQITTAGETLKDAKDDIASFGKELRATSIDATRLGLIDFLTSLGDRTKTFSEKAKEALDSIVRQIQQVIARRLVDDLFDSLFGLKGKKSAGILDFIKDLFGRGKGKAAVGIGEAAAHTTEAAAHTADATAASAVLQTGATAASATLQAGITASSTGFTTSVLTAASSFASLIISAGAAFAASVAAGGAAQAAGGIGSSFAGAAATGMFPAVPGGVVRIVEGGFPEAVLTTDPKHAVRQVAILRAFLRETRGLGGRIRGLAQGGFALPSLTPSVVAMPSLNANLGDVEVGSQALNLRILNLLDKRQLVGGHLRSAEGARDIMNVISENADDIGRRLRIR